jgi:hypothetical protein
MRKNVSWGLSALAILISTSVVGIAAFRGDGPQSGVDVGDYVSPFDVQDITGPNKGTTLCYR